MRCSRLSLPVLCSLAVIRLLPAQTASKVDFAKDVLPILRQNCVTCHSGRQPASGMRLDRKSAVLGRRGVVPGSSDNSFLYLRVSGNAYGMQMPPTGAMRPEQVKTIKQRWPAVCDEAKLSKVDRNFLWRRQFLNPYAFLEAPEAVTNLID